MCITLMTRQCTYNVTEKYVRTTIAAVEKQKYYLFWVCICSLGYPACKTHVPYYIFICGLPCCFKFFSTLTHTQSTIFKLIVLLTVHHSKSVQWNQSEALFIQFIENQGPLQVLSITWSSTGVTALTAIDTLRAYVSWPCHDYSFTAIY
jgi:hypothetical protein